MNTLQGAQPSEVGQRVQRYEGPAAPVYQLRSICSLDHQLFVIFMERVYHTSQFPFARSKMHRCASEATQDRLILEPVFVATGTSLPPTPAARHIKETALPPPCWNKIIHQKKRAGKAGRPPCQKQNSPPRQTPFNHHSSCPSPASHFVALTSRGAAWRAAGARLAVRLPAPSLL
jgi:hypothetical protein